MHCPRIAPMRHGQDDTRTVSGRARDSTDCHLTMRAAYPVGCASRNMPGVIWSESQGAAIRRGESVSRKPPEGLRVGLRERHEGPPRGEGRDRRILWQRHEAYTVDHLRPRPRGRRPGEPSTLVNRATPVPVSSGGIAFRTIKLGGAPVALSTGGAAYAWGLNTYGGLGDGTTTDRRTPTAVAGGLTFP